MFVLIAQGKLFLLVTFKRMLAAMLLITLLSSCSSINVEYIPSKNQSHRVKFLVMHYTADDFKKSLSTLINQGSGVSSHYLIPQRHDDSYEESDVNVLQLVDESARAWHAGRSHWQGREDLNDQSIGIEIINIPECHREEEGEGRLNNHLEQICFFPDYDQQQIEVLIKLTKEILKRNPDIGPTQIIGHSDIAPQRKHDPGPRFPWQQLYQAGIGAWYDNDVVEKYWQKFLSKGNPNIGLIQKALKSYGYHVIETHVVDKQTESVIKAFQSHFVPWNMNGKADEKTNATLFALLEKYFPRKVQRLLARYEKELLPETSVASSEKNGQIDQVFPQVHVSNSLLSNDRARFKAYQGKGELILDNVDASSVSIYVNGQLLPMKNRLQPNTRYQYAIGKLTVDGLNTLKVENVMPKGTAVNISIPYPVLEDDSGHYQKQFKEVDKLINQDVEDGFPGAVLMVVKDGKIIKRSAYGYARKYADGGKELLNPEKLTVDHLFDLASNTKMFATNLALMKLNSRGLLDFNKTVNYYLPEYQGDGRNAILVKDLLTHRAGYSPEVKFYLKDNKLGKRFFSQNKERTKELLLQQVPLETGKHSGQVYSDTDYMLLGLLVERITGTALDTYVENNIYKPLSLSNSLFNPLIKGFDKKDFAATEILGTSRGGRVTFENIRTHVLQGEVHDEKAFHSLAGVAGHAGLFSTADDIAVLTQMLLNRGGYGKQRLFSANVLDQFIKPSDTNGTYGLGWRRADNGNRLWHFGPYASPSAYGHTGWTGTVTVVDPELDLAIILLTNARHTEIVGDEEEYYFTGSQYQTGKYGSVISLIYEAVLNGGI